MGIKKDAPHLRYYEMESHQRSFLLDIIVLTLFLGTILSQWAYQ